MDRDLTGDGSQVVSSLSKECMAGWSMIRYGSPSWIRRLDILGWLRLTSMIGALLWQYPATASPTFPVAASAAHLYPKMHSAMFDSRFGEVSVHEASFPGHPGVYSRGLSGDSIPPFDPDAIYTIAEVMPLMPSCAHLPTKEERNDCSGKIFLEWFYGRLVYPSEARSNGIEGTVVVTFVVEKNGDISGIRLLRDIGGGCGAEVVRLLEALKENGIRWLPGKQRNVPVRVQFNFPVKFKLTDP